MKKSIDTSPYETEPSEAFPYLPPSKELKIKYNDIFARSDPVRAPLTKILFDKIFALFFLILASPLLLLLVLGCISAKAALSGEGS